MFLIFRCGQITDSKGYNEMTTLSTLKIDLGIYQENLRQTEYDLNNFEYTVSNDEYDQIIDDMESKIYVFGIEFSPSEVLKRLDPTAYRLAKMEYEASFDVEDLTEYQDLQQEVEDLTEHIEYLENKIYELELEGEK